MTDTVLVSGGSGYIAGFLIRQLVAQGWMVHTTVRSLAREAAVRDVLALDNRRLRFFAADLNADAGWGEIACSFVVAWAVNHEADHTSEVLFICIIGFLF